MHAVMSRHRVRDMGRRLKRYRAGIGGVSGCVGAQSVKFGVIAYKCHGGCHGCSFFADPDTILGTSAPGALICVKATHPESGALFG